jgi:large subunit ribosomal protein L29
MKASEIRALGTDELRRKLDQTYEELFNLRFQWASNQIEDHNRITTLRRDVARMKTILREREIAQEMQLLGGAEREGGVA